MGSLAFQLAGSVYIQMRKVLLKIHLVMGLAAALFLIILGLTGSIMAFEGDIDHWIHPGFWQVAAGQALAEGDLIAGVERKFAPLRVQAVEISQHRDLAQLMQLSDNSSVSVNPYTGGVMGRRTSPGRTGKWLGFIHQVHLRLAGSGRDSWAPAGKIIISYAGVALFLLAPTGLLLWWRAKRGSVRWRGPWFRVFFDLHQVIGIYAGLFLWMAALTGILIGFEWPEKAIFSLTHSARPGFGQPPPSTPMPGAAAVGVDRVIAAARYAIPNAAVELIFLPTEPDASYMVILRVPEETSGSPHSTVAIDQYSGRPLAVHNFLTDSQGYRWIRFNRSIHTGDIGGLVGHIVMSLSSLLLVVMAITGIVIWLKKLAF